MLGVVAFKVNGGNPERNRRPPRRHAKG
jgi:hypothetical protein